MFLMLFRLLEFCALGAVGGLLVGYWRNASRPQTNKYMKVGAAIGAVVFVIAVIWAVILISSL